MKKSKKLKKENKLKELAKFLHQEVRQREQLLAEECKMSNEPYADDANLSEYDEKVSIRFTHFVSNLIKLKDKIRIEIRPDMIYINGNLDGINNNNGPQKKAYIDDIVDIRITKSGFTMCRNYGNGVSYKDPEIFDSLCDIIKNKSKEINKEILLNMIDEVMIKTNLSRESNLDEILQ